MAYIYILTNYRFGTLYIGVTNNILRRVQEHRNKKKESFTRKYNCIRLVYVELHGSILSAIAREKSMKHLLRREKIELITSMNPDWKDLYEEIRTFVWD